MNIIQVLDLLGKPYAPNGFGPDEFNCWGLLTYVQKNFFYRDLPFIPVGNQDETIAIHEDALNTGKYWLVDEPKHGDAVLLRGGDCPHVGIWLIFDRGGVLHSLEGMGVVWTPRDKLNTLGFGRSTFYRIKENARNFDSIERPVPA